MAASEVDVRRGAALSYGDVAKRGVDRFPVPTDLDWSKGLLVKGEIEGSNLIRFVQTALGRVGALKGCRVIRNGLFELSFENRGYAEQFFALGPEFEINGKKMEQRRPGDRSTLVYVHGLPFPVSDVVLSHYLKDFGEIRGIKRETWSDPGCTEQETGVRIVKMVLQRNPPNFLRVGQIVARLSYAGLKKVCAKCLQEGHLANACKSKICFNCGIEGHIASLCPDPCSRCEEIGHSFIDCHKKSFAELVKKSTPAEQHVTTEEHKAPSSPIRSSAERIRASSANSSDHPASLSDEDVTPILTLEDLQLAMAKELDEDGKIEVIRRFQARHPSLEEANAIIRRVREQLTEEARKYNKKKQKRKKKMLSSSPSEPDANRQGEKPSWYERSSTGEENREAWPSLPRIGFMGKYLLEYFTSRQEADLERRENGLCYLRDGSEVRQLEVTDLKVKVFVMESELATISNYAQADADSSKALETLKTIGLLNSSR